MRLTDYYSISEATELILGLGNKDKSKISEREEWLFIIVGQALERACLLDNLEYINKDEAKKDIEADRIPEWGVPLDLRISEENITKWLKSKDEPDHRFNIRKELEFCNENGDFYSKKLHIAYKIWLSLLRKYRDNPKHLSFENCKEILKERGLHSDRSQKFFFRIINWQFKGGRQSKKENQDKKNQTEVRELIHYWKLSNWVNIHEAVCFIMDKMPYLYSPYELGYPNEELTKYASIREHLENLAHSKEIESEKKQLLGRPSLRERIERIPREEKNTFLKVSSLEKVLKAKIPNDNSFFFKRELSPFDNFPNPRQKSPFHAPRLAIVCEAWFNVKEIFEEKKAKKNPKQEIQDYLKKNHPSFVKTARDEMAAVANWKSGGATPTPF